MHRTDCMDCGAAIYHPPIGSSVLNPSAHELSFWGARKEGKVYKHHPDLDKKIHYILIDNDGLFVAATCQQYWNLHKSFERLEDLVNGTKDSLAAD